MDDPDFIRCCEPTPVTARILELLEARSIPHRFVEHGPTRTSEESAAARGESIDIGGKSIVLKVGDTFRTVREVYRSIDKDLSHRIERSEFDRLFARFNLHFADDVHAAR